MTRAIRRVSRILHWPADVGGHPSGLAAAERSLGRCSTVAVLGRSRFDYPVDIDLNVLGAPRLRRLAARAGFLAASLGRYDLVHCNFGQGFLPAPGGAGIDLPLLRALGARVFMTFQGCDARCFADMARHAVACCGPGRAGPGLCTAAMDPAKRAAARYASRHADRVFVLNPDLRRAIPSATFVPYASVDPRALAPDPRPREPGPVRVLHAPTSRLHKGTAEILAVLEPLAARGRIELILVEGLTRAAAIERYRRADLLIDQARVGWYGGLAVELMSLGRPAAAFIREQDLTLVPPAMAQDLPIARLDPADLAASIEPLIDDPAALAQRGAASRAFVERWHDPLRIAARLIHLAENPADDFWPPDGGPPDPPNPTP